MKTTARTRLKLLDPVTAVGDDDREPSPAELDAVGPQARQVRHALAALSRASVGRQRLVRRAASDYLSQIDRVKLPLGCDRPIWDDDRNRSDAFRMRRGDLLAKLLGIACRPSDRHLPGTARAVLAELDAPVRQLTEKARATGQPHLVAVLHLLAGGGR